MSSILSRCRLHALSMFLLVACSSSPDASDAGAGADGSHEDACPVGQSLCGATCAEACDDAPGRGGAGANPGTDDAGPGGPGTGGADAGGQARDSGTSSDSFSTEVTIEEGDPAQCEVDGVIESTHSGFTGVGYLNTDNELGAGIEWTVDVGEAGTYALEFAYANEPAGDRPADVLVDGMVMAADVSFPSTSAWTSYASVTVDVALSVGENRIVLQSTEAEGLANIDSLTVSGVAVATLDCDIDDSDPDGSGDAGSGTGDLGGATIFNDTFWEDTSGTPIYSQGGGILQVGDTYYWYGVKYRGAPTYVENPVDNDDTVALGITTYSSKDLVHWTHEATDTPDGIGSWFGRLGVAYNENTEKYVLVAQSWLGGDAASVYFATSDSPAGGFVFDHAQQNPPGIANGGTGDQTIFQDTDGKAYVVSSSQNGRSNRYISPLRESDFLEMQEAIPVYSGEGREGNCMFKYEGTYYFCSSDLHGWNTSQTYCVSSDSIYGPWSEEFVLNGTENDYSHVTQAGFFIHVYGTEQTTIIYAGDRWANFAGNGIGFNQWVPLSFQNGEPRFHSLSAWTLNATTGRWAVAPENNWVLNPTFEADRISVSVPVGWNASSGSNSQDGRTGRWSWQLNGTASLSQAVEELPNGTYSLGVWAKSDGEGAELFAQDYGGSARTAPIAASSSWARVLLEGIVVTDGRAEVGVRSNGQTVKVDDFTMIVSED